MKVSVVIPCFNEEKTIGGCINSFLKQKPDEIIVVDDNSTDNTQEVVKKIGGIWYIKVGEGKNRGPANARNLGWKAASGDIIVFKDADAIAGPDYIKKVRQEFERTGADVLEFSVKPLLPEKTGLIEKCFFYKEAVLGGLSETVVRRKVLEALGGFDQELGFGEDRELSSKYSRFNLVRSDETLEVAISRVSGLREYFERQLWYGRTMIRYLAKTGDKKVAISFLFSLSLLLLLIITATTRNTKTGGLFLLLALIWILRSLKIGFKVYRSFGFWQGLFLIPAVELSGRIIQGVGIIYGFILMLLGGYYVGR